jgi:hypothetical protein
MYETTKHEEFDSNDELAVVTRGSHDHDVDLSYGFEICSATGRECARTEA